MFGQTFVLGRLIVPGSAAATAQNILASEGLYRLGFAIPLLAVGFHIAWAFLLYQLFRVVDRTVNALALLVILVGCAIQAVGAVIYLVPLLILQDNFGGTLTFPQQQGLAMAFVKLSEAAFNAYLVFFGAWCVLTGYLILRCWFMPRIIGALLIPDGIGWMLYLWPPVATMVFPVIAVVSGVAEFSLLLWMLIFGVNNERWYQQAPLRRPLRHREPDRLTPRVVLLRSS